MICTQFIKTAGRSWVVTAQSGKWFFQMIFVPDCVILLIPVLVREYLGERQIFILFEAGSDNLSLVEASTFVGHVVKSKFNTFYVM